MSTNKPVNAVATAFLVVETLARQKTPQSVTAIAATLGLTKTKVHRHLHTLIELGYVKQLGAGGAYGLTGRLAAVAQGATASEDIVAAAQIVLPRLRDRLGLTVTLGQATGAGVEIVAIERANSLLQITTQTGAFFGLSNSAHGKVALAFGPDLLRQVSGVDRSPALRAELELVRAEGWATAPGAILAGINALAVPVLDESGQLLGSIAALGSLQSVPAQPSKELLEPLITAAAELGRRATTQLDAAL
jgi:DNA-binding IclR family transcriptional regulator